MTSRMERKGLEQATPTLKAPVSPRLRFHPRQVVQRAQEDPSSLTPTDVKVLQRSIGNQATTQILSPLIQQENMKLGPADDAFEREADQVADRVVRQMESAPAKPVRPKEKDEEDAVQRSPLDAALRVRRVDRQPQPRRVLTKPRSDLFAQRDSAVQPIHGQDGGAVEQRAQQTIRSQMSGGKPLAEGVRRKLERGFGADLGHVREHTGSAADRLSRSLNARAFTVQNHVFYRSGEQNNIRLKAHEITHTFQQGSASSARRVIFQRPPQDLRIQRKIAAQDFETFVEDQELRQHLAKENPEDYAGKYTTVGFEHEFAQMTSGPLRGVSHLEVAKSKSKMPVTGLPFILETDASNALELVSPPFLVETISKDMPVPEPDDIEYIDTMMKSALEGYTRSSSNLSDLLGQFKAGADLDFELEDVRVKRENMTPNTPDEIYKGIIKDKTKVDKGTLLGIQIELSKKGAGYHDEHHISTHVNFATDAQTYDEMQEQYQDSDDDYRKAFAGIENQLKEMLFRRAFATEYNEQAAAATQAQKEIVTARSEAASALRKVGLKFESSKKRRGYEQHWEFKSSNVPGRETISNVGESIGKDMSKAEALVTAAYRTPGLVEQAQILFGNAAEKAQNEIISLNGHVADPENAVLDYVASELETLGTAAKQANLLIKALPTPSENKSGLRVFFNSLARTLSGQMAVESIAAVKSAQEARFKSASRKMGEGLMIHQMLSSRVKDVKEVWIKDTIMSIGLGILSPEDWSVVARVVADKTLHEEVGKLKLPTLTINRKPTKLSDVMSEANFVSGIKNSLQQIGKDISKNKLTLTTTDRSRVHFGVKKQSEFMTHDKTLIGARQDTYIASGRVQMPKMWGKKRLHVVESRMDTVERLRELKRRRGLYPEVEKTTKSVTPPQVPTVVEESTPPVSIQTGSPKVTVEE